MSSAFLNSLYIIVFTTSENIFLRLTLKKKKKVVSTNTVLLAIIERAIFLLVLPLQPPSTSKTHSGFKCGLTYKA